jgi:UDP-N-acetyl-D-mannosaminuronic acid dehydrogenase
MPAVLNLKSDEVDTNEKRSKYTVSVVGCGQKGILYANAFAEAGFTVICTDADASVVKKVAKGKTASAQSQVETKLKNYINKGQISVSSERKDAVSKSDVIVIAVGAKVDEQKKTDYSQIVSAAKQVGAALHQGTLVIYGGIAGFGFIEGPMKETLENTSGFKVGTDFGLAYNPILTADASMANLELKVAATDPTSLNAASTILKTITKEIKEVTDLKTAEIATLFTVAKQDSNRALANEMAVFCENANIDYFKILKLLELNDPNFCPTIVDEESKHEAYLLLDSAENFNAKLRLPTLARQINEDMVKHAVNLTQNALRKCGKPLRRARVAVLGTANPTTATGIFVKMIELKGAKASLYDPVSKMGPQEWRIVKTNLNEAVEGTDCIVILTGPEQFKNLNIKKLKALMKNPSVIVDLIGIFEPKKVEAEGFIYCGLGRGTDKN